jgi:hypothetical protein
MAFERRMVIARTLTAACIVFALTACAHADRRFPLRDAMWRDDDLAPVTTACRKDTSKKEPQHVACTPKPTPNPLIWDGLDNLLFRPLSESLAIIPTTESVDVNSMDEVPDSSWFQNRVGTRGITPEGLALGGCRPAQILDGTKAADHSWIIDKGKDGGASEGFRVTIPGKGKFLFKADDKDAPEHASAAQTIGLRILHAAGYNVPCDQFVYFKPSVLKLTPGLTWRHNFEAPHPFRQGDVDRILKGSSKRGELVRMEVSAWLPGAPLGGFEFQGTRKDDPNDVVPHENRRELRGRRVIDAWIDRVDERQGNTFDTWIADGDGPLDASPGHVVHYSMDTSEAFGDDYASPELTRRLGYSYLWDWGDLGADFITLGARTNVWERVQKTPGEESFVFANVRDFVPDEWKNEYSLAAFSRMTERDAAWAARILARFTPKMLTELAAMADFTKPRETAFLEYLLEGRLHRVLERYLTRLSSIADLHVEANQVCGVDLAELRDLRAPTAFRYTAAILGRGWTTVERSSSARVCARLPRIAGDGGAPDDDRSRYLRVRIDDAISRGPLVAHLYDLGPSRGFKLVGVERPDK